MARLERAAPCPGWVLRVRGDEDEAEAAERARLDEILEPDGTPAGELALEPDGVAGVLAVLRDEAHATLRLEGDARGLRLRGSRTALKAWLELWGLTGEGAGDYYLELVDATGGEPVATDLRLCAFD